MNRRAFLTSAAGLLIFAGCAKTEPNQSGSASPVVASGATASAAAARVAADADATGVRLSALFAQALALSGVASTSETVGEDWLASLGAGELSCVLRFAETSWATLGGSDEQPDDIMSALAGLVAPKVNVIAASGVEGELSWLVTTQTAAAGITSLDKLGSWSARRVAAVPSFAKDRADGLPGIKALYQTSFTESVVEEPTARVAALTSGKAAIAAFRRTDYLGAATAADAGLVALLDPDKVTISDPLAVLVPASMVDAAPQSVLVLEKVAKALTTSDVVALGAAVAGGQSAADAATAWLQDKKLV